MVKGTSDAEREIGWPSASLIGGLSPLPKSFPRICSALDMGLAATAAGMDEEKMKETTRRMRERTRST